MRVGEKRAGKGSSGTCRGGSSRYNVHLRSAQADLHLGLITMPERTTPRSPLPCMQVMHVSVFPTFLLIDPFKTEMGLISLTFLLQEVALNSELLSVVCPSQDRLFSLLMREV